jgi:hypothetical protein
MGRPDHRSLIVVLGLMLWLLPACSSAPQSDRTRFATPEEAAQALMKGLGSHDAETLKGLFGSDVEENFSSGDPVSDRHDREVIALAMAQSWRWAPLGDDRRELVIGDEQWPFPVPLMKVGDGWQFDTDAGKEEVLSRRIGRNELRVIDLSRAYVLMQQEYASQPHDGKRSGLYAQKLRSTPGRHDGLYWSAGPNERPSPLGDLAAQAESEGYGKDKTSAQPLWGYRFRILTAQGPAAKGGATSYIVNGEMSKGFGLIAWPNEYGRSGVMTFVVNKDGVVYQKDLGESTAEAAAAATAYDPDGTWTEVKDPS